MNTSDPTAPGGPGSGGNTESVRIGDADRNAAVEALGEHLTTGRLDLEEYGSRSALANTARTVGDIRALFADLPAPQPMLPGDRPAPAVPHGRPAAAVSTASGGGQLQVTADERSRMQKLVGAAAAASGVIALILFLATGLWWWFLLIPLISSVARSVWGEDMRRRHRSGHGRR
jgi:hypothetical protein